MIFALSGTCSRFGAQSPMRRCQLPCPLIGGACIRTPTGCATKCSFEAKWLLSAFRRIHGFCTELSLDYLTASLDELTHKTLLAYKNRAAALHRFTHEADHLLSLGLHQGNPGGRAAGVWVVLRAPIRHFHQDRDEVEPLFRQDILLFALILP